MIHVLHHGFSLCGMPGPPGQWPEGDRWVAADDAGQATCLRCLLCVLEARVPNESEAIGLLQKAVMQLSDRARRPLGD